MGDYNYVHWLDRKYGDRTYWRCEIRQCKAKLHTILENDKFAELYSTDWETEACFLSGYTGSMSFVLLLLSSNADLQQENRNDL